MRKLLHKTTLLLFLTSSFNSLYANIINIMEPEESLTRFSSATYNQLKDVEEADSILQGLNFTKFLQESKDLAKRHEVADILGIRLVHKHNMLNKNEIMVENYETWNGQKALVTRPVNVEFSELASPASWILGINGYEVFEYSKDGEVKKEFHNLLSKPQLFIDFYNLAESYHLEHLVSPAILKREWEQDFTHITSLNFLEKSYAQPSFASVVTPEIEIDPSNGKAITTAWPLYEKPITHACQRTYYCQDSGGAFGHARVSDHYYTR